LKDALSYASWRKTILRDKSPLLPSFVAFLVFIYGNSAGRIVWVIVCAKHIPGVERGAGGAD